MTIDAPAAELEVVQIQGVRIPIDPEIMSPTIQRHIREGKYERGEAKNLPGMIEPGERLVELGGGIGFLSALVALQRKADFIAVVEANPALIPLIERTHRANGVHAEVRNAAVVSSKDRETAPFYLHHDFWASSLEPIKPKHLKAVIDIPLLGLDELIRAYAPTMLIIDVEGSETELLNDVRLDGVRKVFMEIHHKVIGQRGVKAIFDYFSREGFCYDSRFSQFATVLFSRMDE